MAKAKKDILLLVDGNALIHRGFHAIPHLSNKKGEPTNGVYGFAMLFLRAIKDLSPKYVIATFDLAGPTFREKIYEPYKAQRVAAPQELYDQIPKVKELVRAFNVPIFEMEGYEADDLIGSIAEGVKKDPAIETVILTGDLDTLQLIDENVKVLAPKQGLSETKIYDRGAVEARYGLTPEQLLDYKALRGDPSDNIPGVSGIGEKTACELLRKFGTLDEIYKHIESGKTEFIKPRVIELLKAGRDMAYISKKLGEIVRNLKIKLNLSDAVLDDYDEQKVYKLFQELEFKSLLDKIPKGKLQISDLGFQNAAEEKLGNLNYKLIDTKEKYEKFLSELQKQKVFAIDTETTSLRAREADLVGVGFSWETGKAYYLPKNIINNELIKVLEKQDIILVGHNIKYDLLVLKRFGINLQGQFFDTMIAAYLLNPGARNFTLDGLAFTEFGFRKTPTESLIGAGRNEISMSEVAVEKVSDYCCEDADYTLRLKEKLEGSLSKLKLDKIFFDIEMLLIPVLAEMEYWGVRVDPKVLKLLSKEATKEIAKLQDKIYRLAGEEFNIGSPLQLKKILFDKLGIPSGELKKGKTGLSTAATELEKLRGLHPIVDLLFEWRELSKLQNTYLDALPALINKETGRVHTSFNQTIAATGRLSSSDPNLQNIPIRTELGRKVRSAFVAPSDYKLVSIDYSQIELRLAAHLSGDEKMIKVFNEGGDIHTATAQEIFDLADPDKVTADMRRSAKTINFGVLYGLSAYGLKSRIPGVSQGEAQDFIDKYFETYPRLTKYLEEVVDEARRLAYVKNEIGRIRFLPEIKSSQWQVRAGAERAAINMPFQSMNADIIKMAMNKLREVDLTNRDDCRLLLQVHDELVFEIKEKKIEEYAEKIVKIMSGIYKLKVPLAVEAKVGDNWEEIEKLPI